MSPTEVTPSEGKDCARDSTKLPVEKHDQIGVPTTPAIDERLSNQSNKIHLPSSSVSLVELSESTKNLINSLSQQGLSGVLPGSKESEGELVVDLGDKTATTVSAVQSPITETFTQQLPKAEKKPVKFTVRKVSRDTINTSGDVKNGPRQYSYGNMLQNQPHHEKKPLTKSEQLQRSQTKYDGYAVRVEKINKEIEFLTNLLPPYNVEIDYATRNKIARAIEKLKSKQDELQKKKYSIGITLSRLWRDHDERELWVRAKSNQ